MTDVGGMFPDHFCNADQSDHPMSYTQHVQFNIYDAKKTFANIYDGPFYVKGLRGMYQPNIPKSPGFSYGDCYATAFSAILSPGSSTGAFPVVTEVEYTDNPDSYTVQMPHAIIGWKQSNGFTYPANFLFNETAFHNVGYRHGVVDDLSPYSSGADTVPAQGTTSGVYGPQTAFDYQTIIYDLDGTLTGVVPSGGGKTVTNAISSNTFLSERGQMPECQAIGSQTSASEHINLFVWSLNTFGLPIFRQWTVDDDAYGHGNGDVSAASCGQPCTADHDRGCPRGMYMAGPFQTTLLSHVGRYFIDLASGLQNADSSVAESYPEQCLLRSPADYQNRLGATAFFNCSGTTCFAVPDEQVGSRTFSMSVNYGRIDTNLTLIMYVGNIMTSRRSRLGGRASTGTLRRNHITIVIHAGRTTRRPVSSPSASITRSSIPWSSQSGTLRIASHPPCARSVRAGVSKTRAALFSITQLPPHASCRPILFATSPPPSAGSTVKSQRREHRSDGGVVLAKLYTSQGCDCDEYL